MNDLTNLFAVHSSLKKKFQTIFPNYFYPKEKTGTKVFRSRYNGRQRRQTVRMDLDHVITKSLIKPPKKLKEH